MDGVKATTFEAWTITATLARDTRRVRVGQLVTCALYRHPSLLAKMASTVDCASHGRLNVGLGAGWNAVEAHAYGYTFPDPPERLRRLRETAEVLHRLWTEETPEFAGCVYRLDHPINEVWAVQRPHPPLWIGGGGEAVHLVDRAAEADRLPVATVRSESAVVGPPAQIVEHLQAFIQAGIDYFILTFPRVAYDHTPLRRFVAEVVPCLGQAH